MPREEITDQKMAELVAKFKEFLRKVYYRELVKATNEGRALLVDYKEMERFNPEFCAWLVEEPETMFKVAAEAIKQTDLGAQDELESLAGDKKQETEPEYLPVRFMGMPDAVNIRDIRSRKIGKFIVTEGIVRRASEVRPEITETEWECLECNAVNYEQSEGSILKKPFQCSSCGNRSFRQVNKRMIDTRWINIEEPFEITEGEKPTQLLVFLSKDLVSIDMRRMSDPGNRIKICGVLRERPKGKFNSATLEFYLDANSIEYTEIGWEKVEIEKEDEDKIKEMASDPDIYKKLVESLAPSIYGYKEIKESIILQMFSGVPRIYKDKMKVRGEIHILIIGDPASGKSQLLKLVPNIIPRGRYVSGKGVTGAGLTATVTKDETMGGWVLEAGAMVLSNKGMLAVDEFEKMEETDQVAMHEALEQGSVSIAKASIVATLPAQTSVLAGGNPKFSRFDDYKSIADQINIPDTLLSRFDLKFVLRDKPNTEKDRSLVDHVLKAREGEDAGIEPAIENLLIKKYIAYAKKNIKPRLTKETGKLLKDFYLKKRKQAEGGNAPIPITLRQFESMLRLSEASAKIQLSDVIRREDAERAIRLMEYSLRDLGWDATTGMIDVDKAEGGTSHSDRSKIRVLQDLIHHMSQTKKEIHIRDLREAAKREGIPEHDFDGLVDKLKREGMLFEPNPGFVQKV
jgi:replicative DNA helicase Mcm